MTITSGLPSSRVPFDPLLDFGALIKEAGLTGVLDPNSIAVVDVATGSAIPAGVTEDFSYGDRGRLEWVIVDPKHATYDVKFTVVVQRPNREPQESVPLVGVGDLLRYNVGSPRPIALPYLSRLVDLTGDGKPDLVGCWNYAYRPGWPWDGIVCYPRTEDPNNFLFGDLTRLRSLKPDNGDGLHHFTSTYMNADLADLNADGLVDIIHSPSRGDRLELFLNSGQRDAGGMPVFMAAGSVVRPKDAWEACRAVDLNGDGAVDLVVGDYYLENTNRRGWPMAPAAPVRLGAGSRACFADLDDDGRLDSVCLVELAKRSPPQGSRVAWKRNLGGTPPRFGPPEPLPQIEDFWCSDIAAVVDGTRRGLLVQHDVFQMVSFYQQLAVEEGQPRFRKIGRVESKSAVMSLSDQAWPCLCDWNGDGNLDLLVGGGYGWPRILLNEGTAGQPSFSEPQAILSNGEPIRILLSEVYPGCDGYKHNMGYPYPVFVDWDGDGLSDLMLPNCSNRLFWYRNVGTRREPRFGPRQQLNAEGFEDTPEKRAATGQILMSRWEGELEPGQAFFWRTGAAFSDFNGDGLMDFVT
ncbi:MAG TPA: VCBS repeat-containing protein, partial [Planctomycetaceae bacterium]|nr:VCBS repeat-containing protein [Planctomycetaceae bacterium]